MKSKGKFLSLPEGPQGQTSVPGHHTEHLLEKGALGSHPGSMTEAETRGWEPSCHPRRLASSHLPPMCSSPSVHLCSARHLSPACHPCLQPGSSPTSQEAFLRNPYPSHSLIEGSPHRELGGRAHNSCLSCASMDIRRESQSPVVRGKSSLQIALERPIWGTPH